MGNGDHHINSMRALFILLALSFPWIGKAEEKTFLVRAFTLKHIPVEEAVVLLKPMISSEGSMTIEASRNALIVRDFPKNVVLIEHFLARLDRPPSTFSIIVKLLQGRANKGGLSITDEIQGLGKALQNIFPYAYYDILGESVVKGVTGDKVAFQVTHNYEVEIRLHYSYAYPNYLRFRPFVLYKMVPLKGKVRKAKPLLRVGMNVRFNQPHVVGVMSGDHKDHPLLILIQAKKE